MSRQHVLAVVGESGSGKSTLARAALRLEAKARGRVIFDGEDVFGLDARPLKAFRRSAQIVFQNPTSSLNPRKTVPSSSHVPWRCTRSGSTTPTSIAIPGS